MCACKKESALSKATLSQIRKLGQRIVVEVRIPLEKGSREARAPFVGRRPGHVHGWIARHSVSSF